METFCGAPNDDDKVLLPARGARKILIYAFCVCLINNTLFSSCEAPVGEEKAQCGLRRGEWIKAETKQQAEALYLLLMCLLRRYLRAVFEHTCKS